jgi:uncharacterized protein (DUF697 family)/GTP-binding protein EngB required for normal cell division
MSSDGVARPDLGPAALEALFGKELAEAYASLGCFNLAIFGKTGAGKSTLLNAIFGEEVAETGVGRPVTKGLVYYRHPDAFLGIFDSEGFETGTSGDVILHGLQELVSARATAPIDQRIHAVWYAVRWSDRRFEQAQQDFVRRIANLGLPVIIVITQVPFRDGRAHPEAVEFADFITQCALPVHPDGRPVLTNAVHDPFTDSPVAGLHELLDVTYAIVPEAVEGALTAAQRLDLERKKKAVAAVIRQAVAVASGVGAAPIPFADAALLVPNQVTMIARITAAYGLPASTSRTMAIAGSVVLTGGATMAGRYAVTNLLKFVPGGQIAGSAISATVAAALTKAVGVAWSRVCEYALTMDPQQRDAFLSSGAVSEVFRRFMRQPGDGVSVEP